MYAVFHTDSVPKVPIQGLVFARDYSSVFGGPFLDLILTMDLLLELPSHSEILKNIVPDAVFDNPD